MTNYIGSMAHKGDFCLDSPSLHESFAETMNRVNSMMVVYPFLNPSLNVLLPVGSPAYPDVAVLPSPAGAVSPISPPIKQKSEIGQKKHRIPLKRTSSFKPIGSNEGCSSPHFQPKKSVGLQHLEELGNLRRIRLNSYKDDVRLISECNLCGTCSFACTTKFLGTFMRQHLYTHMDLPLFSCNKCPDFQSNSKDKATKHAWRTHNDDHSLILDHRSSLDSLLKEKAKMCFSTAMRHV